MIAEFVDVRICKCNECGFFDLAENFDMDEAYEEICPKCKCGDVEEKTRRFGMFFTKQVPVKKAKK